MQVRADDIAIHEFVPSDGSESAAIKVIHRQSAKEAVNASTASQLENLRAAMVELVRELNPTPDQIRSPAFMLFDRVRLNLPQSLHEGKITDLSWDYTGAQWKFFFQCGEPRVDNWYVGADLDLLNDS